MSEEAKIGYDSSGFKVGPWEDWTETIKVLYIDRLLSSPITVPNLEILEIGPSIENVQVANLYDSKFLTKIESHSENPPELPDLSNSQYMNLTVIVPEEALDAYKTDPKWGLFWNLQGDPNLNSVESVIGDLNKTVIGQYDLSGSPVDENFKGLVIVRFSDDSTKKIIQK